MRSGNIYANKGRLYHAGLYGYDWSAIATSELGTGLVAPSAYNFHFNAMYAYLSNGPFDRWRGYPL